MKEIMERRSVRAYTSQPVPDESLQRLLKAAMRAPSAGNSQPWEFVVIRDRNTLDAIQTFHPYAAALQTAPCAIVVCGNLPRQIFPDYWVQDCSAATENILLEAVHLGLGAVWMGLYPMQERVSDMSQLLELPETVVPLCVIAVGFPAQDAPPVDTFHPEYVHFDRWDQY